MHVLMIFLDGVGLGKNDLETNPFATANLPTLHSLTDGQRWLSTTGRYQTERAIFVPTDARLGVNGRPQSATGQATILTGVNVPLHIGEHYGPRPNQAIRDVLARSNLFMDVVQHGKTAALLEAYPPDWHKHIHSGKRLPSSYQYAAQTADVSFYTSEDLKAGRGLSGDWTGQSWRTHLGFQVMPVYTPYEAGVKLVELAHQFDFTFFPHWITDFIGHRGTLSEAIDLLETFDGVLKGILDTWADKKGVVIVTSDHGNIEEIGNRKHTTNPVPTLVIGDAKTSFPSAEVDLSFLAGFVRSLLLA